MILAILSTLDLRGSHLSNKERVKVGNMDRRGKILTHPLCVLELCDSSCNCLEGSSKENTPKEGFIS
jgi:hypothetical protein